MDNRTISPDMAKAELQRRQAARAELSRRQATSDNSTLPAMDQSEQQQDKINNIRDRLSYLPSSLLNSALRNFSGGMLNTLTGIGKMTDMSNMVPNELKNVLPYQSGQRPIDNFDAYKAMGIEDQPIYTPAGALQTLGELALPVPSAVGKGIKKGYDLAKEIPVEKYIPKFIKEIPTKKYIKNSILKPYDELENKAIQGFEDVSNGINERGINNVPVDSETIEGLREFFPRTKQANSLLEKAKKGDYNSLRKLQSQLYKEGKKNLSSDLETERMRGLERLERRNEINDAISEHLKTTGNHDLNDILNSARKDFKKIEDIYYNKNMSNAIKKLVNPDIRKVPKNLIKLLQEESIPMQELRNFHPGLEKALKRHQFGKNALIGAGITSGGLIGVHELNQLRKSLF